MKKISIIGNLPTGVYAPMKEKLFNAGVLRMTHWCEVNKVTPPPIEHKKNEKWRVNACAYYRPIGIHIAPDKCAALGFGGRAWSWPGYVIDRTPFGVLQHELGHHIDWQMGSKKGRYWSEFSERMFQAAQEPGITSYAADNVAEWFAEMFRLFVTNADLLHCLRPRTYALLTGAGFKPVSLSQWEVELKTAPQRIRQQAEKKVRDIRGFAGGWTGKED